MKSVVFCRDDPRHIYFANSMEKASSVLGLVVQRSHPFARRLKNFPTAKRKFNEVWRYLRQMITGKNQKEQAFFSQNAKASFIHNRHVLNAININDKKVEDMIQALSPDLILTLGCGILKRDVFFEIPKIGILNLHSGIVPKYRGVDNVFWCLHNQEPQMIGATIHYIDRMIDTGEILAQVFPKIETNDNEYSLFNRTILNGIEVLIEILSDFKKATKKISGRTQSYKGNLYKDKDRILVKDLKVYKNLTSGVLKYAQRDLKKVFFYEKTIVDKS